MKILRKISALWRSRNVDADMSEELRLHLEQRTRENMAAGMSLDEARYAAARKFGSLEQVKAHCREQRADAWFEQLARDLRFTARGLRRSPGFAIVAVLTLAIGIGANTAIFTALDGALLRPLRFSEPER